MAGVRPENLRVSDIKSRLLNIAQTSLYRVTIPIPPRVSSFISQRGITPIDIDNISLLCSEASLPGSSLATHEVTNDYHGVTEKMAYRRMYDENLDLTFYVDRNYKVIELFETWMDYITGDEQSFSREQYKDRNTHYRMSYPNSYKTNIFLIKFERDHHSAQSKIPKILTEYTFVDAFPTNIIAMPVSYDQSDVLKCTVSFSYQRYVRERNGVTSSPVIPNKNAPGVPELSQFQKTYREQALNQLEDINSRNFPENNPVDGRYINTGSFNRLFGTPNTTTQLGGPGQA
jgi:hypothetical protein